MIHLKPRPPGKPSLLGGIGFYPLLCRLWRQRQRPGPGGSYEMDEWMDGICTTMFLLLCYAAKDPAILDERRPAPTVVNSWA